jgi:uncharacterized protein YndB with AHSA1/START domain
MSPWSVESTASSDASREKVWALWTDAAGWPRWNPTLKAASMDGPISEGTAGSLEHTSGRKSDFVVRDVQPEAVFATESAMPGARLRIEHEVVDKPGGGSRFTQRALFRGPLGRVWSLIIGRQVKHDITAAVEGLARMIAERG